MEIKPISIITINYNDAPGLSKTLESVRKQTFKNINYVIIDGGSTDESLTVIKNNADIIDFYCSEKDQGIYDAQNKGILKANGTYLLFLNSGDLLAEEDFLSKAADFIIENKSDSFIYCDTVLKNADDTLYNIIQPDRLDLFFFFTKTLNHQSCLISRDLFFKYGLYDTQYKICADFDFILNLFTKDEKQFKHLAIFAAVYDNSGFSADTKNYSLVERERKQIISNHLTKAQIAECLIQQRKINSWQVNVKNSLYNNRLSYSLIKLFVKIKNFI